MSNFKCFHSVWHIQENLFCQIMMMDEHDEDVCLQFSQQLQHTVLSESKLVKTSGVFFFFNVYCLVLFCFLTTEKRLSDKSARNARVKHFINMTDD